MPDDFCHIFYAPLPPGSPMAMASDYEHSDPGGEQQPPPDEPTHSGPPRDQESHEPLGPLTPDEERPAGDTAEAHDEITPHDLPKGHPGRQEAERQAEESESGTTRGNR